jgi:glutamate dehydrogenase/leucine dehydrogenase
LRPGRRDLGDDPAAPEGQGDRGRRQQPAGRRHDRPDRGILYAPDYVINGGGIINVAAEIRALEAGGAFDGGWVATKLDRLAQTLAEVIDQSIAEKRPANLVADEIARARIAAARG